MLLLLPRGTNVGLPNARRDPQPTRSRTTFGLHDTVLLAVEKDGHPQGTPGAVVDAYPENERYTVEPTALRPHAAASSPTREPMLAAPAMPTVFP